MAETIVNHFEKVWGTAVHTGAPSDFLYEDLLRPSIPTLEEHVLIIAQEAWEPILRNLGKNPEGLFNLSPRRFEELVVELLAREGFEVHLTPSTGDGGRDVLAIHDSPLGKHLYAVECKRFAKERPVGVALVRSLYGVVEQNRNTAGILVTTSHFTKGALRFQEEAKWRLALKSYDDLCAWIHRHTGFTKG